MAKEIKVVGVQVPGLPLTDLEFVEEKLPFMPSFANKGRILKVIKGAFYRTDYDLVKYRLSLHSLL